MLGTLDKTVITPDSDLFKRVAYLEDQVRTMNQFLNQYFVQGRTRTNRQIPSSSGDVNQYDLLGDVITTPTLEYILIYNSASVVPDDPRKLEWRTITLNTF